MTDKIYLFHNPYKGSTHKVELSDEEYTACAALLKFSDFDLEPYQELPSIDTHTFIHREVLGIEYDENSKDPDTWKPSDREHVELLLDKLEDRENEHFFHGGYNPIHTLTCMKEDIVRYVNYLQRGGTYKEGFIFSIKSDKSVKEVFGSVKELEKTFQKLEQLGHTVEFNEDETNLPSHSVWYVKVTFEKKEEE